MIDGQENGDQCRLSEKPRKYKMLARGTENLGVHGRNFHFMYPARKISLNSIVTVKRE